MRRKTGNVVIWSAALQILLWPILAAASSDASGKVHLDSSLKAAPDAISGANFDTTAGAGKVLFDRTCAFYRSLPGFSADLITERIMNGPDSRTHTVHSMHAQSLKNGYFYLKLKQPQRSQILLRRGEVEMYTSKWNMHTTQKCPSFVDLLRNSDFNFLTEGCFIDTCLEALSQNPDRLGKDVESFTTDGRCRYGGVNCIKLRLHRPFFDTRIWIDAGKEPWIKRIEPVHKYPTGRSGNVLSLVCRYRKASVIEQPEIDELRLPKGSTSVIRLAPQMGLESPLLNAKAPSFKLRTVSGASFDLSKQRGKIVVMEFWATWCEPCKRALPQVSELSGKFSNKNLIFLAINKMESADVVKSFVDSNKLNFNFCLDSDGRVCEQYHVTGIPHTVIVGKDGLVKSIYIGNSSTLKKEIGDELESLVVQ